MAEKVRRTKVRKMVGLRMCVFVFMCNCVVCECERKGEKIDLEYLRECV